jgi:hypothetical protein
VVDAVTGESGWLDDEIDGPALFQFARDGTELVMFRAQRDADLWMIELGEEDRSATAASD